jgi:hypothetical protein
MMSPNYRISRSILDAIYASNRLVLPLEGCCWLATEAGLLDQAIATLRLGDPHRFSDWPNRAVPAVAAGVYSVWDGDELIYVGMAGRSLTADSIVEYRASPLRRTGLFDRLNSHASGRRSGDQFCVYVCDRLVVPTLTPEQLRQIGQGELSLDRLTRD